MQQGRKAAISFLRHYVHDKNPPKKAAAAAEAAAVINDEPSDEPADEDTSRGTAEQKQTEQPSSEVSTGDTAEKQSQEDTPDSDDEIVMSSHDNEAFEVENNQVEKEAKPENNEEGLSA